MALDLRDCTLFGPALPEPFVKFQLEKELTTAKLLAKNTGPEGKELQKSWEIYRRKLQELTDSGGALSVKNHVLDPLIERLGYASIERTDEVETREGVEDGGWILTTADGQSTLRAWSCASDTDLDAPSRRGHAYRFSPNRVAQRVLLAKAERVGLLTDGQELRLLICDPARPESHVSIPLDRNGGWRSRREVPDSYRLLLALASPGGVPKVPALTEEARLTQTTVTRKLRDQARHAIESFVQELLDHPQNREAVAASADKALLARDLWKEGLILVYRLLFILKLESSSDPARAFSFASTDFWRDSFSPNRVLAEQARGVIDEGIDTGALLESSLRSLFRLFSEGLTASGIHVAPLGGMLFGTDATPTIDRLNWGEQAVARLIDHLLWTPGNAKDDRERVHYGTLDVEDLGRVYEALLELEPGIAIETMCRLKRAKLEVVLPLERGEHYRGEQTGSAEADDDDDIEDEEDKRPKRGTKTKVQWIEEIPAGRFYLRVGLGRKSTGSYYTPHPFVRFLVQETLAPQVKERSPQTDPNPGAILALKVLDPAMGSGHFLIEACRYLGDALYEACRLCDELAVLAEDHAASEPANREKHLARARELRSRVELLPDPADELVAYLPSRIVEGSDSGYSQRRAEALCRRLVAVHCLYGVDKNPLAVELAKLVIWLESYAEGMPLTFMDHRLVCGDSLTGPFFEQLLTWPVSGKRMDDLFVQGLENRLKETLAVALKQVRQLEATIGKDVADLELKRHAKTRFDETLAQFRELAAAWTGAVMSGEPFGDRQYERLAKAIMEDGPRITIDESIDCLVTLGQRGCAYDLNFPEVFHPDGELKRSGGFNAVLGNPPWEGVDTSTTEFYGVLDLRVLDEEDTRVRNQLIEKMASDPEIASNHDRYRKQTLGLLHCLQRIFNTINRTAQGPSAATPDLWQPFAERAARLLAERCYLGLLLPSSFHANDGATGIRELYLFEHRLEACFSYENLKKLFEIDSRQKFALVVAQASGDGTKKFRCAFYLHETEWLFGERGDRELEYTPEFLRSTTGEGLNFLELRSRSAVPIALTMYRARATDFGRLRRQLGVLPSEELHTSKQRHRTRPLSELAPEVSGDAREPETQYEYLRRGILPVCKGENFHHFDPLWNASPPVGTTVSRMAGKDRSLRAACAFRLVLRRQARSTDERTVIANLSQPGMLFFDSAVVESRPFERPTWHALALLALCNSYPFDWLVRQLVAANVTFNFLDTVPVPRIGNEARTTALVHAAVRLLGVTRAYEPMWREQLGQSWHEAVPAASWPVLVGDNERWRVRAGIDALVAGAYGLSRDHYQMLLSSFSHTSYPAAPALCLAAFEELQQTGLEAFCKSHDPYWDVPLNESLPVPVLDLPELHERHASSAITERGGQLSFVSPDYGPLFREGARDATSATTAKTTLSETSWAASIQRDDAAFLSISRLLEEREVITSKDAQTLTGLDAAGVRPHLQRLVDEGRAVVEGERRGTKYRRVQERA